MTQEESLILELLKEYKENKKKIGCLLASLRMSGESMQKLGKLIAESPSSVKVTSEGFEVPSGIVGGNRSLSFKNLVPEQIAIFLKELSESLDHRRNLRKDLVRVDLSDIINGKE